MLTLNCFQLLINNKLYTFLSAADEKSFLLTVVFHMMTSLTVPTVLPVDYYSIYQTGLGRSTITGGAKYH
jgi:hypothetical protein